MRHTSCHLVGQLGSQVKKKQTEQNFCTVYIQCNQAADRNWIGIGSIQGEDLTCKFELLQTHIAQDVRLAFCTSPNNVFCLAGATDLTLPLALANIEQEAEICLFVVLALLGLLVLLS
jgi:hypothetical protein